MCKGPNYRERANTTWAKFLKDVRRSLNNCIQTWAPSEEVDAKLFDEWKHNLLEDVHSKLQLRKKDEATCTRHKSVLHSKPLKTNLENFHKEFVLVPTDKAGNNISVICKKFYIEQSLKEPGIFQ